MAPAANSARLLPAVSGYILFARAGYLFFSLAGVFMNGRNQLGRGAVRRSVWAVGVAATLWQTTAGLAAQSDAINSQVVGKVKASTVMVLVADASNTELSGSGCFVGKPGVVLTNAHVLGMLDGDSRPPIRIEVVIDSGEAGSRTLPAKLLGVDNRADLAAIKVEGEKLPSPLPLSQAELYETQPLYIFGFPFGKRLGANITVTKSSVSSLRKARGVLNEIQLQDGLHSGNSGGPVVDVQGRLAGVAVSAITGTTIGFAIPTEHVAGFLAGRLNDYGTDIVVREGGKLKILYRLNFIDPLGRIKDVRIEHYQGPRAKPNPSGTTRPKQRPGETTPAVAKIPYLADGVGALAGELEVEPLKDPKFVYWFRPVYVDGEGREWFGNELSGMTAPPVDRRPQVVNFKPPPGDRPPMELTNISAFRLRLPGLVEESRSLLLKAVISPSYQAASGGATPRLSLAYRRMAIGLKRNGKAEKNEEEFNRLIRNMRQTSLTLELDDEGVPLQSEMQMGQSERALREQLVEINNQLLGAWDLTNVPIRGGEVKPLETFRVRREAAAGMPGLALPAQADLKITFQGTHDLAPGRPVAVFDFIGPVRPRRGDQASIGGKTWGRVEVRPDTGETLQASSHLKIDMDVRVEGELIRVSGTMDVEYRSAPAPAPAKKPDKPPVLAADDKRTVWEYKNQHRDKNTGAFKRNADATWTETNTRGEKHTLDEWQRNKELVYLVEPTRNIHLRFYDDRVEIRNRQGAWGLLYNGGWASK